jgi:hypothetical protein
MVRCRIGNRAIVGVAFSARAKTLDTLATAAHRDGVFLPSFGRGLYREIWVYRVLYE